MKLSYVLLLVGDIPAAVRFWRDAMGLTVTYSDETIGYASFDTGSTTLALYNRDKFAADLGEAVPIAPSQSRQTALAFLVDDVDAVYVSLIERGATSVAAPQDRPAMQARNAYLSDPDGHLFEIYTSLRKTGAPNA